MKRFLFFVVAVLAFVACAQSDIAELSGNKPSLFEVLHVGFEGDDTRIHLVENKTVWNADDRLSLFYKSHENIEAKFLGNTGDRSGDISYNSQDAGAQTTDRVVVAYPYDKNYRIDADAEHLEIVLADEQSYMIDSYDPKSNIMVATSSDHNFVLRNVCGWLKLQLRGNGEVVESIMLEGNAGEQIAGYAYVNVATAEVEAWQGDAVSGGDNELSGTVVFDETKGYNITLDCGEGVKLSSTPTNFYFALLPTEFKKGICMRIKCEGHESKSIAMDKAFEVKRNYIKPMEVVEYVGDNGAIRPWEEFLPEDSNPESRVFPHKILLVDHTGVGCSNCPRVIDGLIALADTDVADYYHEVGVHGGSFATGNYADNAYSDAASVVDKFYRSAGYPAIRFNFHGGLGDTSADKFVESNSQEINDLVKRDGADAGVAVYAALNNNEVSVAVGVKAAVTQEYKVTAWLLENGISNPSQEGASYAHHYISNHALRNIAGAHDRHDISGDSLGIIVAGETNGCTFTIPILSSAWDTDNMEVLVIVSAKDKLGRFDVVNTALCDLSSTIDYYGVKELYVKPEEQLNIALSVDKNEIKTDGEESVTFSVSLNNQSITNGVTIYSLNDSKALNGMSFSTTEAGEYRFIAQYNGSYSNEVRIVAKSDENQGGSDGGFGEDTDPNKEYKVGDYYNVNGVEGIVFGFKEIAKYNDSYTEIVGYDKYCYLFSMDQEYIEWSTENVICNALNYKDGAKNMLSISYQDPTYAKYPAAKWCADHGEGWYLPASDELHMMWNAISGGNQVFTDPVVAAFNKTLIDNGGQPIEETFYWTSNEVSESHAEVVCFSESKGVCLEILKSQCYDVRAVYRFIVTE